MMDWKSIANSSIAKPRGTDIIKYSREEGELVDIISEILDEDRQAWRDTVEFSKYFDLSHPRQAMYDLWAFVRKHIRYKADPRGRERIKGPAALWKLKVGDCKSMSIFIGSVLRNLNVKYKYRFTSYTDNRQIGHVYVIARYKGKRYILDATIKDFDTEIPYTYKEDKKMTEIRRINGINKAPSVITERATPTRIERLADAPKNIAPKRGINPLLLTEGEMVLTNKLQELEIDLQYYGDPTGMIRKAMTMIENALHNRLHTGLAVGHFTGYVPPQLSPIASLIRSTRSHAAPAGAALIRDRNVGIYGFHPAIGGVADDIKRYLQLFIRNGGDIDILRNSKIHHNLFCKKYFDDKDERSECVSILKDIIGMNDQWEDTSYHILYEFLFQSLVNSAPQIVTSKWLLHKLGVSKVSDIATMSRMGLVSWSIVGIKRQNMKNGLEPLIPQQAIGVMMQNAKENSNIPTIGAEPVSTAIVIGKIVSGLIAAIKAASLLKQLLSKGYRLETETEGFGTDPFGPSKDDWIGANSPTNSNPNDSNGDSNGDSDGGTKDDDSANVSLASINPLWLVAGAGLLYTAITDKNKSNEKS